MLCWKTRTVTFFAWSRFKAQVNPRQSSNSKSTLEVATMTITIRPGTRDDLFDVFVVFQLALHGLYQSVGQASPEEKPNPEDLSPAFEYFRTFTEYFTQTAEQFW